MEDLNRIAEQHSITKTDTSHHHTNNSTHPNTPKPPKNKGLLWTIIGTIIATLFIIILLITKGCNQDSTPKEVGDTMTEESKMVEETEDQSLKKGGQDLQNTDPHETEDQSLKKGEQDLQNIDPHETEKNTDGKTTGELPNGKRQDEVMIARSGVEEVNEDEGFVFVEEEAASFPGGDEALYAYLSKNIHYPELARESNISGTVVIKFVVEKDGSITRASIIREIGGGCGEEALRVVKGMPKWKPGKQSGHAVRSEINLPVQFILH